MDVSQARGLSLHFSSASLSCSNTLLTVAVFERQPEPTTDLPAVHLRARARAREKKKRPPRSACTALISVQPQLNGPADSNVIVLPCASIMLLTSTHATETNPRRSRAGISSWTVSSTSQNGVHSAGAVALSAASAHRGVHSGFAGREELPHCWSHL